MELEELLFKKGAEAFCAGWAGDRNRERITSKDALMLIDFTTRTIEIAPIGRGESMTVPMENARQWKPKQQKKSASTRSGTATSAKA